MKEQKYNLSSNISSILHLVTYVHIPAISFSWWPSNRSTSTKVTRDACLTVCIMWFQLQFHARLYLSKRVGPVVWKLFVQSQNTNGMCPLTSVELSHWSNSAARFFKVISLLHCPSYWIQFRPSLTLKFVPVWWSGKPCKAVTGWAIGSSVGNGSKLTSEL